MSCDVKQGFRAERSRRPTPRSNPTLYCKACGSFKLKLTDSRPRPRSEPTDYVRKGHCQKCGWKFAEVDRLPEEWNSTFENGNDEGGPDDVGGAVPAACRPDGGPPPSNVAASRPEALETVPA